MSSIKHPILIALLSVKTNEAQIEVIMDYHEAKENRKESFRVSMIKEKEKLQQ